MKAANGPLVPPLLDGTPLFSPVRPSFENQDDARSLGTPFEPSKLTSILSKLEIERKIKEGAQNLLHELDSKSSSDQRLQVESELAAANAKIAVLEMQLVDAEHSAAGGLANAFSGSGAGSGTGSGTPVLGATTSEVGGSDLGSPFLSVPFDASPSVASSPRNEKMVDEAESEDPSISLDALMAAIDQSQSPERLIASANSLVQLLSRFPFLKYDLILSQLTERARLLLLHRQTQVTAAGYRLLRYAVGADSTTQQLRYLQVPVLLIRSLAKDSKCQTERIQALKLIRYFLDSGSNELVTPGMVCAVISVAEQNDDTLKNICLETLAEIFVFSPELVSTNRGVRVLLQAIVEGPRRLSTSIAMTLAFAINFPQSRAILNDGNDLEMLISPFTEVSSRGHVYTEHLENSARVLCALFRSWSGIFAFSGNNFFSIRCLVECLKVKIPAMRDVLLDLIFSVLGIKSHSWSSSFIAGRRLTMFGHIQHPEKTYARPSRYANHFTALLLTILHNCNLVENLISITLEPIISGEATNVRKATLLLSELMNISSSLLPPKRFQRMLSMSSLFAATETNALASHTVFQLEKVTRSLYRTKASVNLNDQAVDRVKLAIQMDDTTFKQLIVDTQVLQSKNFTKWNWDALAALIQGPFRNPKRLEELIKTNKFLKRLMSFYRPFKYRFSSIKRTRSNQKYVKVGRMLIESLLQTTEGIKYLGDNKLLRQVAECLAQLDPMSGITSSEPLFSADRIKNTLTYGYFALIGALSADPNGLQMMSRWRIFNMFYHLSELKSRQDLIICFISSMDYSLQGHPRIILSKALTSGQKSVRLFATKFLRTLKGSSRKTQNWVIELLVTQFYDPEVEVCRLAIQVLDEFCVVPENLQHFVQMRPSFSHLGDIGTPLLLRFLRTSEGFDYLRGLDYVHQEMDNWFHGLNDQYVFQIEEFLEQSFSCWTLASSSESHDNIYNQSTAGLSGFGIPYDRHFQELVMLGKDLGGITDESSIDGQALFNDAPKHFYGELTMTDEGCTLLKEKGHFQAFVDYIQRYKQDEGILDEEELVKLKGCLWAVGHIGSNSNGIEFIEGSNIVLDILQIATSSSLCSLRGTAFFVLGLISSTIEGGEILDEQGWDCVFGTEGASLVTLPRDLWTFFNLKSDRPSITVYESKSPLQSSDPARRRIIAALCDLSNQVLSNSASKELVKLKSKYAPRFATVELFQDALEIMSKYRFRYQMRRFIFELFDVDVILDKMTKKPHRKHRHSVASTTASGNQLTTTPET